MTREPRRKKQLNCYFNEYIELTVYLTSSYSIKVLSSLSFFESLFVND